MKYFLLSLILWSPFAHAVKVATCQTSPHGQLFGSAWLPCSQTVIYVDSSSVDGNSVIAIKHSGVNRWDIRSTLVSGDVVLTDTANPKSLSTHWWNQTDILWSTPVALSALLNWNPPSSNTDGSALVPPITYSVFQGSKGQSPKPLVLSGISALTYTASSGLSAGTTVCWNITATEVTIQSDYSAEVCKVFPAVTLTPQSPTTPGVK